MSDFRESLASTSTRMCRRCRYLLDGLGPLGNCPECGTEFPPFWTLPTGRAVFLRLGWPYAVLLALFAGRVCVRGDVNGDLAHLVLSGGVEASLAAIAINTPVQVWLFRRSCAAVGHCGILLGLSTRAGVIAALLIAVGLTLSALLAVGLLMFVGAVTIYIVGRVFGL